MLLGGLLGPFVGLNAVYHPGPSQPITEMQSYAIGVAGAALVGATLGFFSSLLFGSYLPVPRAQSFLPIIIAFASAIIVSAETYFVAGLAVYVGFIALCPITLVLFGGATAALLSLPWLLGKLYRRPVRLTRLS